MFNKTLSQQRLFVFLVILLLPATLVLAAEDGGHKHGAGSLMTPHIGMMFWTIVTFIVTLLILRVTSWKPLLAALEGREEKIRSSLEDAAKAKEDAENLLKEYEKKLKEAHAEVERMIEKGKKDAEEARQAALKETEQECERMRKRNNEDLQRAKEQALEEIFQTIGDLSIEISSKLIKKSLDRETQNKLIEEGLKQYKGMN